MTDEEEVGDFESEFHFSKDLEVIQISTPQPETSDAEVVVATIVQELPTQCDTCGAYGPLEAIKQISKTAFGSKEYVVGYNCGECGTSHLYRM